MEELFQKHWGNVHSGFCYPPVGVERAKMFPELEQALEVVVEGGKENIVEVGIDGVGWISLQGGEGKEGSVVKFSSVGGIGVRVRTKL